MDKKIIKNIYIYLILILMVSLFGYFMMDDDKINNIFVISVVTVLILRLVTNVVIDLLIKEEKIQKYVFLLIRIILVLTWISFICNYVSWQKMALITVFWVMDIVESIGNIMPIIRKK